MLLKGLCFFFHDNACLHDYACLRNYFVHIILFLYIIMFVYMIMICLLKTKHRFETASEDRAMPPPRRSEK